MPSVTSTPGNSQAAPQHGQPDPSQVRVAMLPALNTPTIYANAFQTYMAQDEILLTACLSRQENSPQGSLLTVQPQQAIAMTPDSARRLLAALSQAIRQYDAQFGKR